MEYKEIIYFETREDVDDYMRSGKGPRDGKLFIALNPSVRTYCKKRGISDPAQTAPYLTNESHLKLALKSKELSDWISVNLNFARTGFKITGGYRNDINRWMKFFIKYYLLLIEIVSNSCELHKPRTLMASWHGRKRLSKQFIDTVKRLFLQPEEKHMGVIIKRIAEGKGISFEDISTDKNIFTKERYFLTHIKRAFFSILFVFLYLKHKFKTGVISNKLKLGKKPIIMFTTSAGYMKRLAEKLEIDMDASFYFLQRWVMPDFDTPGFEKIFFGKYSKSLDHQRTLSREFIHKMRKEKILFSYQGVSFSDILSEKFENDIAPYIMGLHMWTTELDKIIRKLAPSLVISAGNRLDDSITGELCRDINIPAVMASHGSFVYQEGEIGAIELEEDGKHLLGAPFSFIALQSPLAEGYTRAFPPLGNTVKTGPLIWGNPIDTEKSRLLSKKIFGNRKNNADLKVVLHAATQKPNTRLKFHIYETPDEYIQSILDLVDAISKTPETVLIVRFKPRDDFSVKDIRDIIPFSDKIILSVDEPFIDILGMSDLLVSLSSTTITEAFQNKIPVLLYGGRGRYRHIPAYEIKAERPIERSAAYYIKDPRDLKYGVSGILDLKLDRNKDTMLFDPYIYKEHERVSLLDLLNTKKGASK